MNWSDYVVVGLVAIFAIAGLLKGIVMSVFRVLSFFISIYASVKFSPVLSGILEKTSLYTWIKDSVVNKLLLWGKEASATTSAQVSGTAGAEAMISPLPLPEFFKKSMLEKLPAPAELIDMKGIVEVIGDELTKMIISVLSLITLYFVLSAILAVVGLVLKGVSKLPLFKQADKLGGLAFGTIQGILAIYIICAILVLFNANTSFVPVFNSLDNSLFAGYFYENNFIINWMFPKTSA